MLLPRLPHRLPIFACAASFCLVGLVRGQDGPATVVVAPVIQREVAPRQSFLANVKPRRQSVIGSAVDGRVQDYLVDAGQAVTEGQELAQLRIKTIEIELAGAEAELSLRQAELDELKNGSLPEEIQLAEASERAAVAAQEYAQAKLSRAQRLFNNASGLSQDEFEAAQAAAISANETLSAAKNSLKLTRDGPRIEKIQQAAARVEAQEQVVEGLRDRISKYTIRAPFDGFVAAELTEAGAWVQQGDAIAEIVEIDPVEVEVFVPESSIRYVHRGDTCEILIEAVSDKPLTGKVDRIIPLADDRSRTFPVRILVDNPPRRADGTIEAEPDPQASDTDGQNESRHELLPGMLARASLPTGEPAMRMLVPKDALQLGGPNPVLMKAVDGKAAIVPVRTGPSWESWISVTPLAPGALAPGDLVITRGNERLRPGQEIAITEQQSPP